MRANVVILSAFLSPFRSGAEACTEEVAPRLSEEFDITIVTSRLSKKLSRQELQGRIRVIRIGTGTLFDKWLYPFLAPFTVRKLKPHIVHAILESFAGAALIAVRFLYPQAKRVLTCQSTNTTLLLRTMHRSANVVTAISSVLVQRAEKFGKKNIERIPNGITIAPLEQACMEHGKVPGRILFVGRLEPMKGVDTLITAFAQLITLPDVPPSLHLHVVGDGSLRAECIALAERRGVTDRVRFLGRLTDHRLFREYAEAEIFCGLSRSEALGNVFLEAQATGCAVVATRVGGIPDIVHHEKNGILVAPNDAPNAAQAMHLLSIDPELRLRLVEAGREYVKRFDWDAIAPQYAKVYRSLQ